MSMEEALRRIAECKKNHTLELNLSSLNLEEIPQELTRLVWLKYLNLNGNQLSKLEGLNYLYLLKSLNLSENQLTKIEGLENLKSLESLGLSENQLTKIEGLDKLQSLTELNLIGNQLTKIEGLENLKSLTLLYLDNNQLTKIEGLENLKSLTRLDLDNNQLTKIEGLDKLQSLTELYLRGNQLTKIENLDKLQSLTELNLIGNQLTKIEGLENLKSLTRLDLDNNQLTKIEGLDKLQSLTELYLRGNQLTKIENLDKLQSLTELNLIGNQLTKIEGLENLKSLTRLDLDNNQLTKIEGLDKLQSLTELYLDNNQLTDIENLDELQSLTSLDLSENKINLDVLKIVVFPENLIELKIANNPFCQECGLVLDEYWDANHLKIIKSFLAQEHRELSLPCRIMLLGNHAAGKSSLLHYIKYQTLAQKSRSTHGLQVESLTFSQSATLPDAIFFDFGGQDYYHGIYRLFLRQQSSQIIVVNPSYNVNQLRLENSETVDNQQYTQDFSLDYWAAQLSYFHHANDEQIMNKDTFLVQSYANSHQQQWHYSHCLESRLLRFDYLELKNNPQLLNLQHFREALLLHIKSNKKTVFQTEKRSQLIKYVLANWHGEKISSKPIKVDTLNLKLNKKKYPLDWFKIDLSQLSAAGLIWYDEKIANGDFVWLNPKALVEDLHQRVFSPECLRHASHQGRLTAKELEKLKLHQATIELLQFYRVIFKHQPNKFDDQKIEYIIPNYLPLSSQDNALYSLSTFGLEQATFRLRFLHFMPIGLINHVVCFFGLQPDYKLFWRDLIVFTLSEELQGRYRIMIKLDFNQLEIQVCIQPQNNKNKEEYQQVKKYLFYCLMRFYWDLYANDGEPATFTHFRAILINNEPEFEHEKEGKRAVWGNPEYCFGRPIWSRFYAIRPNRTETESLRFIPNDLYVSIGAEHWVYYHQLAQHPNNEPHIQSYRLEESTPKLAKVIPVKPFEIFLNRELRAVKKIFISYSRKDVEYKDELSLFLKTTLGSHGHEVWDCGLLEEGKWDEQIQTKLAEADLVIFMLSINFFASNYIVNQELLNTLANINQANAKQKIMCIVVKTFPWDSFARLAKQSHVDDDRIGELADIYHQKPQKEDITQYQFLPYRRLPQSSINDQKHELIMPLARMSADERDEVYSDIVARVMKALGI
ncbi:leucine-rich repeat domain-containing protein [Agitococcus lubricus]|uniref:Internalin A n=1 Tax=Agitococcus lubricus TaxID=1077255 RepID=A0A2T5J492_9GAMM|nr:leucine-rich repeat domain-containing protein [Agitococcus lubricus]PTQ91358.1 internalin A [Agitococcus lubricus]